MEAKKLERRKSTQLELPNVEVAPKSAKPALWRIDSKVLRGRLMKELSVPSLDLADKVINRERLLSPVVEDSEDKSLSQVIVDDGDFDPSKLKTHDSKDDASSTEVQSKQEYGNTLEVYPPSNDNKLDIKSNDVEKGLSQSKSDSQDDRSLSPQLKAHSNDDRSSSQSANQHSYNAEGTNPHSYNAKGTNPPQLKLNSNDDRSPSQSANLHSSNAEGTNLPQLKLDSNDDRSPSQSMKPHSNDANDDRSPHQLSIDSNDHRAPHSKNEAQLTKAPADNDRSPSQLLVLHSCDDRSPSQLLTPYSRSPSQLLTPYSRSPSQLLTPHSYDDRSPSQLSPSNNGGFLSFNFQSHSSIEDQVCPLTPAPDYRATSCNLPGVPPRTLLKKKSSFRLDRSSNYNHKDDPYSPSVLPPLKSPLLPGMSSRNITSSPCGGMQRGSSLQRYNTSRSLSTRVRTKHHRKSDSMFSLPEFHAQLSRQHGVLERRMTRQKTGLALGHSFERLTAPDISPSFNSAMSSDG